MSIVTSWLGKLTTPNKEKAHDDDENEAENRCKTVNTSTSPKFRLAVLVVAVSALILVYLLMPRDVINKEDVTPREQAVVVSNEPLKNVYASHSMSQCSPVKNFYYLRQPKTGSITMNSIFYRYLIKHDLKADIRKYPHNVYPKPSTTINQPAFNFSGGQFMIYNESNLAGYVSPDIRVTSLRQPASQLASSLVEWDQHREIYGENPVEHFHKIFSQYSCGFPWYTDSPFTRFFGLPSEKLRDRNAILGLLKTIDDGFDFVVIQEYFEFSMVLLRRLLCWNMSDILFMQLNIGVYEHVPLPWSVFKAHEEAAPSDYMIYQHFTDKLLKTVLDTPLIHKELSMYRRLQTQVQQFCDGIIQRLQKSPTNVTVVAEEDGLALDPRPFSKPFKLNGIECLLMRTSTEILENILQARQQPDLCEKRSKLWYKVCEPAHPKLKVPLATMQEIVSLNIWY